MSTSATTEVHVDVDRLAEWLALPVNSVRATVELLEDGNTVPFITRYRRDRTGGLDEEDILRIKNEAEKQKTLSHRKQSILKSINSQAKLTPELEAKILDTHSLKLLEDLYLPFKPKRQTLATLARERGLEPLADEIQLSSATTADLESRAKEFINKDKQLETVEDVLLGVRHILAERFSEDAELREQLREVIRNTGKVCCKQHVLEEKRPDRDAKSVTAKAPGPAARPEKKSSSSTSTDSTHAARDLDKDASGNQIADESEAASAKAESEAKLDSAGSSSDSRVPPLESKPKQPAASESQASVDQQEQKAVSDAAVAEPLASDSTGHEKSAEPSVPSDGGASVAEPDTSGGPAQPSAPKQEKTISLAEKRRQERREAKLRKRRKLEQAFKGYADFQELISKVPPHRILAINRGERAGVLKVKLSVDQDQMRQIAEKRLINPLQRHTEFLHSCVQDALNRLLLPSLEREVRRELTQMAEEHAVKVFARNLRKLLLQPPTTGRRVLAVDPGFRNGCKLAILDEFGNVLGHGVVHFVGSEQRQKEGRSRLAEIIRQENITAIAIGNGSGCREAEQLIANVMADELKDLDDVAYVIVNEAGASVYSTSELGREELPDYDATRRGAISIGRRLLDPLSELVKINPANIGVGLYQHDMKSKSMQQTLDDIVHSCVNYVGVDVNTASFSLLSYVSGLNQLTARRLYDFRRENGPFLSREQIKEVPGIGDATYVQAAGFLKIVDGDNPLDATTIHPESYEVAREVLKHIGSDLGELAAGIPRAKSPQSDQTKNDQKLEVAATESQNGSVVHPSANVDCQDCLADDKPSEEKVESAADASLACESIDTEAHEGGSTETTTCEPDAAPNDTAMVAASDADKVHDETIQDETTQDETPSEDSKRDSLAGRIAKLDVNQLSESLGIGQWTLRDLLSSLSRPGRDPREDLPPPSFRRGVLKLEDLKPGMQLSGSVLNVVDFGAFVDIGVSDSGLVHISRLANKYVADPHEIVAVGDVLTVWVVEVDKKRRRVSLTAVKPGTEKTHRHRPKRSEPRPQASEHRSSAPAARGDKKPSGKKFERRPRRKSRGPVSRTFNAPKKLVPITKKMAEGKEPMRTFGDLKQFFEQSDDDTTSEQPENKS